MKRRYVLIGLGAIAMIALFSTAIAATGDNGAANSAKKKKSKVGPRGPQGPQGPQGVQGPPGQAGPSVKATLTTDPNLANNTPGTLAFDGADLYDSANLHSPTTNPSRITVPTAGVYAISAQVVWPNNPTGVRLFSIAKNAGAAEFQASQNATSGAATYQSLSDQMRLAAGDFVQVTAVQSSGGNLGPVAGTTFSAAWIAP